jgi:IS30 family transposase
MIGDRTKSINSKKTYVHWEADIIISHQSKSSLVVIQKIKLQIILICKISRKNVKTYEKSSCSYATSNPKKICKINNF